MNFLFCIDDKYVDPLKTTLYSLAINSDVAGANVYVVQKDPLLRTDELRTFCEALDLNYIPTVIGKNLFTGAPSTKRFPETVYYRLLAHKYLPEDMDRVLYIDADILCINDICELYNTDIGEHAFAAANHARILAVNNFINNFRVGSNIKSKYYNTGVILMNLKRMREVVFEDDIYEYLQGSVIKLIMPDQDMLNSLYSEYVFEIENEKYNVDMRIAKSYELLSYGLIDPKWMIENSILLHYCGTDKPWKESANGHWDILYKHYMRRMKRFTETLMES